MTDNHHPAEAQHIRQLLARWAQRTRAGNHDAILAGHHPDALIFDVLPPMQYEGVDAYRASWDKWQPETQGEARFDLEDLRVVAGTDVAFAHAFVRCGGTLANGNTFEDLVRATFCLQKLSGHWLVVHQHISKPHVY